MAIITGEIMHQHVLQPVHQHVHQLEYQHVQQPELQLGKQADHRRLNHLLFKSQTHHQVHAISQLECLRLHVSQPIIPDLVPTEHPVIVAEEVPEEAVVLAVVVPEEVVGEGVNTSLSILKLCSIDLKGWPIKNTNYATDIRLYYREFFWI